MSTARQTIPDELGQVGEIFAGWQVAPSSVLVLGWQREHPALEGAAALQRIADQRGRFTRLSWPGIVGGREVWQFIAAVQLPKAVMQPGDTLLLTGRRGAQDAVLARLPPSFIDPAPFAAQLAASAAGEAAPRVARFLMGLFTPATIAANPAIRTMVAGFLDRAAEADGCVEMLGGLHDSFTFFQGWGRSIGVGCDVIAAGATLHLHAAQEAAFARPDITAPSSGQVLLLPATAGQAGEINALFLLAEDGIRRRPILPDCRVMAEDETAGHVRDMLPRLRCDTGTRTALGAALRPRYEGRFTLYDGGHPVRFSTDLAVASPGAGAYLGGWLYDPAGVVASVHFRRARAAPVRLDDVWSRIPRPDVTDAFRTDATLPPGEPGRHWHGFSVHIPSAGDAAGTEAQYLEIVFCDGYCGFVPIALAPVKCEAGRGRLLATVDLHKPSGQTVIERQMAPFFARITGTAPAVIGMAAVVPAAWTSLIVVPLPTAEPPRALLSHFLADPAAAFEGILFVCSEDWTEGALAALGTLSRFYGAPSVAVRIGGAASSRAALAIAAELSSAEHVLLLGPGTIGRTPGWRRALEAASREHGPGACVSPTVLYEDQSIRFAGCQGIATLDSEPYVRLRRKLAGLPESFARPGAPVATSGVSAACCLIPRAVIAHLSEVPAPAAAEWEPELDLLLHLAQAGAACLWAPAIQVYAPEDPAPADMPERAARLVARWCMRAQLTPEEH